VNAKSCRNLIIVGSAALLLLAFFMNPNQAAHLTAIKQTVALRNPAVASRNPYAKTLSVEDLLPYAQYNNYLVFSTTSWASHTMTYGYFGKIQTNNNIEIFWSKLE
jgi:hypothetical protein